MNKILSEKNSIRLLFIGVVLFFLGVTVFIWKESFSIQGQINSTKFSQFGDFVGGIIGSMWSLAGVILFYVALTEQRKDIQINRQTLETQVDALKQQIKEFELQRIELEETRKVFTEQSLTLKNQRFENTFFQLLSLHHELIDKFSFTGGFGSNKRLEKRDVLTQAFKDLDYKIRIVNSYQEEDIFGDITLTPKEPESIEVAEFRLNEVYKDFFYDDYKQVLSHYFRNIYHVYKFIFTTKLINYEEKPFYASIVSAQLSSDELFLIFYNAIYNGLGYPNFLFLIKEYDIMQNFDIELIAKHKFHHNIYFNKIENVVPAFKY